MRAGELRAATGVSAKALRYWESLGLIDPTRSVNGYRDYSPDDRRVVEHLRDLTADGVPAGRARPLLDGIRAGGDIGDRRPAMLATYRAVLTEIRARIAALSAQRDALDRRLAAATYRATGAGGRAGGDLPADAATPSAGGRLDPVEAWTFDGDRYPLTGRA